MNATIQDYYAALAGDYPALIRQLVPRYDDMLACIVDVVAAARPTSVVDAGTGPGALAVALLERLPDVSVTAVDLSEAMVRRAREALTGFGERAVVVHRDLTTYAPTRPTDVVVSNLALHNVPYATKAAVLRAISDWLTPPGVFVWGDFIRHDDMALQEYTVRYRMGFARDAGCPKRLLEWNFRKEANDDAPLTLDETLDALSAAGFERAVPIWMHDAFLIVRAQV